MTSGAPPAAKSTARATIAAVAVMLLVSAALSYFEAEWQSPTFDEPLHATAGYAIRWLNDYRIDSEDPALFPLLSTLTASAEDLHIDPTDGRMAAILPLHTLQWDLVIHAMFHTLRPDQRSVYLGIDYINHARIVFISIGVILGALIAWWAYRLAGALGAMIAAALFAFDPNFIAHMSQVKNDVPITLLLLWMMFAVWRFGQRGTALRLMSLALACALAVNVKFSGLLFGWILLAALIARAVSTTPWNIIGVELKSRSRRIAGALMVCLVVGFISWAAIWLTYRCRFSMATDPAVRYDRARLVNDAKLRLAVAEGAYPDGMTPTQIAEYPLAPTGRLILWLDDHHLFPDAWLCGFFYTWYTSIYRHAFLIGRHALTGWWYYFPLAMLFKTPLATLVAIAILAARWITSLIKRRSIGAPGWDSICLWLPIVIYMAVAMRTNLDIGVRHVLPVYPFIYMLTAVGFARWAQSWPRARVLAILLVVLSAAETLARWPHEMAFFNIAAGGSTGGLRLLSDSNLDWGQDLPLLAEWQRDHPGRMYLAYFGSVDPHCYDIDYVNVAGGYAFSELPQEPMILPGVFAISATYLQGTYQDPDAPSVSGFLHDRKPLAVLGGTIYVFDWKPNEFAGYLQAHHRP